MSTQARSRGTRRRFGTLVFAGGLVFLLAFETRLSGADPVGTERKRIVVLGDSLAAGLGVEREQAFPALLQDRIDSRGWNYEVVNAGVSGDTSADGLGRIDWLLQRKMAVLILELGGNDGLRGIAVSTTRTNLQGILDRVEKKDPRTRIIVASMEMPTNLGRAYDDDFRAMFPELAKQNHAALIPFLLQGVAGKPGLNQEDRIHPNAAGHKIVAENVWKVLKPLLEELNAADAPARNVPLSKAAGNGG
jgi:acyl-CoA thioesterase-1